MSRVNKPKRGNNDGVAKGYRLKPKTHNLVDILQKEIKGTKNDVISSACEIFYRELKAKRSNTK